MGATMELHVLHDAPMVTPMVTPMVETRGPNILSRYSQGTPMVTPMVTPRVAPRVAPIAACIVATFRQFVLLWCSHGAPSYCMLY